MKIGPKYKIARRLGRAVFEKTQTAKFDLKEQKRNKKFSSRPRSNYGIQLLEKQKVRYTYGLTEKQFRKYIDEVLAKNASNSNELLFEKIENRLDNVVLKAGFAKTRPLARQLVSHGHVTLNGKKVSVPSHQVKIGDIVGIKESSKTKTVFANLDEQIKDINVPKWLKMNLSKKEVEVKDKPVYVAVEQHFDLSKVIQFYKR